MASGNLISHIDWPTNVCVFARLSSERSSFFLFTQILTSVDLYVESQSDFDYSIIKILSLDVVSRFIGCWISYSVHTNFKMLHFDNKQTFWDVSHHSHCYIYSFHMRKILKHWTPIKYAFELRQWGFGWLVPCSLLYSSRDSNSYNVSTISCDFY